MSVFEEFDQAVIDAGGLWFTLTRTVPRRAPSQRFWQACAETRTGQKHGASAEEPGLAVERLVRRLHQVRGTEAPGGVLPRGTRRSDPPHVPSKTKAAQVAGGTMRHHTLRLLAVWGPKSARQLEGTAPYVQSPRNSWGQRLIELRAMGCVEEDGLEDTAGETPAATYRITPLGRVALETVEAGNTWRPS